METKHTPTPYSHGKVGKSRLGFNTIINCGKESVNIDLWANTETECKKTAEFIVKACNSYEDTLEALETLAFVDIKDKAAYKKALTKAFKILSPEFIKKSKTI
jgi:hypothetical protein